MTEEQKEKIKKEYRESDKCRKNKFWIKAMRLKNYEILKLLSNIEKKKEKV